MTVLRHYTLTARNDQVDALRAALHDLAKKVQPLDGCRCIELFHDPDQTVTFVFVEHWDSLDHHIAAGKALGKEAFAPVAATLAHPPSGRYLIGETIA